MPPTPRHTTLPPATPIAEALADNQALAGLARRIRESQARFAVATAALPEALRAGLRPGPLDDEEWCLLVANAAIAAKLRQLVPRVEDALKAAGHPPRRLRIKLLPPNPGGAG